MLFSSVRLSQEWALPQPDAKPWLASWQLRFVLMFLTWRRASRSSQTSWLLWFFSWSAESWYRASGLKQSQARSQPQKCRVLIDSSFLRYTLTEPISNQCNHVNFDQHIFWQTCYFNR